MGRLEKKKQQKALFQTLFFVGIFIFVVFFFFSTGLQFLINATLFINQLANPTKNASISNQTNSELESFILDPPPLATSSSTILITGSVLNFDQLEIYLNNVKVDEINTPNDTFSYELKNLLKTENTFYAIAKSTKSKSTKKSPLFSILVKSEKPKLEIKEPSDNTTTHKNEVVIKGATDKETTIRVNNGPVVVDSTGNFQYTFNLNEGDNIIEIVAEDIVGNIETKKINVKYSKED